MRDERLSTYDVAQILIETIMRVTPGLEQVATTLRHFGTSASMALYEAGYQVTEAEQFLTNPSFRKHVIDQIKDRLPDVAAFYLHQYEKWSDHMKREQTWSFMTKVSPFTLSSELRAIVGQDTPTISFARVEQERQVVALDLQQTKEYPALVIGSVFIDRLSQHIFGKPASECRPISLVVDEAASLLAHPGLARDFREFQSKARQYRLWLSIFHQTMHQLEPDLRTALWGIANQVIFRQHEIESAEEVSRNLIPGDPYMTKFFNPLSSGNPTALPMTEQAWSHANWIQNLPNRQAIVRLFEQPGLFGNRPWKVRVITTPTVKIDHIPDSAVEQEKLRSLERFARPVAEALEEVRGRAGRHIKPKPGRPLREDI